VLNVPVYVAVFRKFFDDLAEIGRGFWMRILDVGVSAVLALYLLARK